MASENCLIEKMLLKLNASRSSMEMQIPSMTDVLDKSNNAMLQIEASRTIKPIICESDTVPFTFDKETVNDLTKIVDKCSQMLRQANSGKPNTDMAGINLEDYMEMAGQRSTYLAGNIRKVLAVWDTVQQMRIVLQRQEMDLDESQDD